MYPQTAPDPLVRFFTGLAEYAFEARMGVCDPPLTDYIANLLVRFVANDAIFGLRTPTGQRLMEVAEMLIEANHRQGEAKRQIHRHIGDFTLFWSGLYPEALKKRQATSPRDWVIDYQEQGKLAYRIASSIRQPDDDPEADLLERLSHDYELCAYGLGEIRREWERRDSDGAGPAKPILLQ